MKISGFWVGEYQIKRLDGSMQSEPFPYSMKIKRDWLGRIYGTAKNGSASTLPGSGEICGAARWGRFNFTWQPVSPYYFDANGFRPQNKAEEAGSTMPIEFTGKIKNSGPEAYGTWRITTWWMEQNSTRKIKVILIHGSWRMHKFSQPGSRTILEKT
ncbi:MAG: hypothetical protein BMS9Abin02_0079 [Anaerolineae bacterium]|nr:MAG: hypothetical protein BMS9Abin02_0079 [Anaerolineae bacterium]